MSHNERHQKGHFFPTCGTFHDLERIGTSKTFPLSIEIAVTTQVFTRNLFSATYHLHKLQHLRFCRFHLV